MTRSARTRAERQPSRSPHDLRTAPRRAIRFLIAAALLAPASAYGSTDADAVTARALLDDATKRNGPATWRDRTLTVEIESRSGDSVARTRTADVEESNDRESGQRTFMEFTAPADVEGALYLHLRPRDGDEQEWIYAPAARRPRRLTPGQGDETTAGAELGYRQVERVTEALSWTADDADATLVGDETLDGRACKVVRLTPKKPARSGIESVDVWLGADDLLVYKLVPNGSGPTVPKQIVLAEYETIDGHATPRLIDVTGRDGTWRTVFRLSDVRYDVGLPESAFSLARLNRGR